MLWTRLWETQGSLSSCVLLGDGGVLVPICSWSRGLTKGVEEKHSREKRGNKLKSESGPRLDEGACIFIFYLFHVKHRELRVFFKILSYIGAFVVVQLLSHVRLFVTPWTSPPDSSAHGILQAGILQWVVIPFSRGFSQSRDWTWVSFIAGGFFYHRATREAHIEV